MFWQEILALNHIIILSIYGQVFFALGLAIFMQSRRHSRLKLARDLRWLALFGILHALNEWGMVFIPIQAGYLPQAIVTGLLVAQSLILAASFVCLLFFGVVLLEKPARPLRWLVVVLVGGWATVTLLAYLGILTTPAPVQITTIAARYLLALPGGIMAAVGLYRLGCAPLMDQENPKYGRSLRWGGFAMLGYALTGGLIAAQAPFFPANVLNQALILQWIGIPIELFRSLTGFVLAVSMIRALELFEVEIDRLIEDMEVEAIQAGERERIGQEIHDGAMQSIYSVALILNSMTKHVDTPMVTQRLAQAKEVLEQVIFDLRRYMVSLRQSPPTRSLSEELAQLADDPRFRNLLSITLKIEACPFLDAEHTGHMLGLVQEALSNIVRHAEASHAHIRLTQHECRFLLEISDDGKGFLPAGDPTGGSVNGYAGYGLKTMRNHARLLDSTLTINSAPGQGTTVRVRSN
jgi:signal transduction histidine kinase